MKKLLLFFVLLVAIMGAWFYAANKFEQIATNDILPKLKESPEIIYADPAEIQINKYMFKVKVGKLEILPDNPELSVTFEDVIICYNPIKDKISFDTHGDKISLMIAENAYYFENLKGNFKFNRSLLKGDISDFDITFKLADSKLYKTDNEDILASATGGAIGFSYHKKDDLVNPKLEIDLKGLDVSDDTHAAMLVSYSNWIESIFPQANSEFALREKKADKEFHQDLFNIDNKFNNVDDNRYTFLLSSNMSEDTANKLASLIINPNGNTLFLVSLMDDKQFDFNLSYAVNQSISSGIVGIDIKKKENHLELKSNVDISDKGVLSDQQRNEYINLFASAVSKYMMSVYEINDPDTKWIYNLSNLRDINQYIYFSYDLKRNELKHDLRLKVKNSDKIYGFESIGDFANNKYSSNIQFDRLGESIIAISTLVQDLSDVFAKKPSNLNENQKLALGSMNKYAQYIKDNGFSVAKVFHKDGADNLSLDGKFEANITVNTDPNNFSVEINDKKGMELLSDPALVNFMNGLPQREDKKAND